MVFYKIPRRDFTMDVNQHRWFYCRILKQFLKYRYNGIRFKCSTMNNGSLEITELFLTKSLKTGKIKSYVSTWYLSSHREIMQFLNLSQQYND